MNPNMFKQMIADSSQFDREKKYWIDKFSGELTRSFFPYDSMGTDVDAFARDTIKFRVFDDLSSKLDHLTNRSDHNLFVVLTAGLILLLNRYTGNDDIVIGMPILKQDEDRDFLNVMMALRNRVNPGMTLKELLLQVKQTVNEANEHANYPIERLEYYLGSENGGSGHSLFETVILLRELHESRYLEKMNHNMVFLFHRSGGYIEGILEYNRDLYRKETVENIASHLLKVLQDMIEKPNRPVSHLDILSEKEREQLLVVFNQPRVSTGEEKLFYELFQDVEKKNPDRQAVGSMDAGRGTPVSLTYKQLNEKSNQLARLLRQKGVSADTLVGIMVSPSLEMVIGIMAISKAGGGYLPIDHESPPDRVKYLLTESHSKILLTQNSLSKKINFHGSKIEIDEEKLYNGENSNLGPVNRPNDLFYTIYTSGTTGRPKGGLLTHRNLVNYVTWFSQFAQLTAGDKTILTSSYAFDLGYTVFLGSLLSGGELHLIPKEMYIDAEKLMNYIKNKRTTYLKMTPSLFSVIVKTPAFSKETCSTLRLIVLGGEPINTRDVERARQTCPQIEFMNHYGPTETTIGSISRRIDFERFDDYKESPTIGKPIRNTTVYIVDKYLKPLPIGVPGDLTISGDGVARGYLNHPELTAEKFIFDRFNRSYTSYKSYTKLYKTGDLAQWLPDGNIRFLGRKDNQVKIRGFRIELGEIQNRILKYEKVKDAVVTTKDDRGTGKYVCSYVVPQSSTNPFDVHAIREFLSVDLPEFMLPSYFVIVEKIPLTPNGKVDWKALPSPLSREVGDYVAPQNEIEKNLTGLWANSLKIEKDLIGVESNFFELGGHSLSAAILISKIHQAFDVQVPLVKIFEKPTIRGLADYLKEAGKELYASIPAAEMKNFYPLSSAQSRLYFLQQMELTTTAYNIVQVFAIEGGPDRESLEKTFRELIRRHESLRTSFEVIGNQAVQRVHRQVEFAVEYSDTVGKSRDISFLIDAFIRPFDLSQAPLIRIRLVKIDTQQHVMMADLHHIISDGISHRVLIRDFSAIHSGGPLPGLRLQYKDYSEWQQSETARKMLHLQETYWLKEFEGEIPGLNLPTDFPRPIIRSFEGTGIQFEISTEETRIINEIAASQGATLFMALLAVFNVFLARLSDRDDVIVGTPIAGRSHADLEKIIGMFVNTLALRNFIQGEDTFIQCLKKVKERTISAFENQDYKFENLVEKANVEKDMSRNPLFDVMFVFRNIQEESDGTPAGQMAGMKIQPLTWETKTSKFDLSLEALEQNNTLYFRFDYCTKLFKKETIDRFTRYFKKIITAVAGNPGEMISRLEIIPAEEKNKILNDFNDTKVGYPDDKTIHRLYEEQVEKTPDSIAVVETGYRSGNIAASKNISYGELNRESGRLAEHLQAGGLMPGFIGGIIMKSSAESVAVIMAILKAGGAYLPIDPSYPRERIDYILEDSRAELLVTAGDKEDEKERRWEGKKEMEIVFLKTNSPTSLQTSGRPNDPTTRLPNYHLSPAATLAYIIYTSGTTGKPKGVMVEHRQAVNTLLCRRATYSLDSKVTAMQLFSLTFDGFVTGFFTPVISGARVILLSEEEIKNITDISKAVLKYGVTHFISVPALYLAILESAEPGELQSLKVVTLAGDTVSRRVMEETKDKQKHIEIAVEYGVTEAAVMSTLGRHQERNDKTTIGKPTWNTKIYILGKDGNLCPIGSPGEIHIGGGGLSRGYLNNPGLTAEKFCLWQPGGSFRENRPLDPRKSFPLNPTMPQKVPGKNYDTPTAQIDSAEGVYSPEGHLLLRAKSQEPRAILYKTGDLARWLPDGDIEFLGRRDHQVKIRGYRIELGEIETRLALHGEIAEAVVIAFPDGKGNQNLCAYVVARRQIDTREIREYLYKHLPGYMVPANITILERLPLTPNGKIDRKALPAPGIKPEGRYIAPGNETEKKLVEIWSRVLEIEPGIIGIDTNFFQLGGHSLNATVIAAKIHKELNVKIPLAEIFKAPTIRGLSSIIDVIGWAAKEKIDTHRRQKREEFII